MYGIQDKINQILRGAETIKKNSMKTTDTPRTDAIDFGWGVYSDEIWDLCRELERELAASQAEVERLKQWKDNLISNLMALEIYEHKHEDDPSVALAAYGQWNWNAGEWASKAEVERLNGEVMKGARILATLVDALEQAVPWIKGTLNPTDK
jgi:hypothetical protein